MQEVLDQSFAQPDPINVQYGGFWARFGAIIIDGIVVAPLTIGMTVYNVLSAKSAALMLAASLVGIAYKPIMEILYGATLGKMALGLKVTDTAFGKAETGTILLRNIFHIVPGVLVALLSISMYSDPGLESVDGYFDFVAFSQQFAGPQLVNSLSGLLMIVEAVMIAADDQKRSLHDRIAGTLVIQRP